MNTIKIGVLAGSKDTTRHFVLGQIRQPNVQYVYLTSEDTLRGQEFDLFLVLDCWYSPRNKRGPEERQRMIDFVNYLMQKKAGDDAPAGLRPI